MGRKTRGNAKGLYQSTEEAARRGIVWRGQGFPILIDGALTSKNAGSGSLEQDDSLGIVAMEEEEQARLMHNHRLGKGQRHAHKTG